MLEVTIKIPKSEYENWHDFEDDISELSKNLKAEIREYLKSRHIQDFDLECEKID